MIWVTLLGLGAWGALLASPAVQQLSAEWLEIRQVVVDGTHRLTQEDVIQHMRLTAGETLLSLDPDRVANRLRSHAWIKEADVSRIPLHTVSVQITERQPAAVLRTPLLNLLLDQEGHVLSVLERLDDLHVPVLLGIDANHLIHGEAHSRRAVQAGIQVAGLMEEVFEETPEVDVGNPSNVVAWVQGLRFQFGSSPFEEKWELYRRIRSALRVPTDSGIGQARGEIDLRYPSKVIVRGRG